MPARPSQHATDDKAVAAVQKVLAAADLPSEIVHKDYGEDLLATVTFEGIVYPARFWVQVKGTQQSDRLARADGSHAIKLNTGHLLRWAQSADPVIVVLWDVDADVGWWDSVSRHVDMMKLYVSSRRSRTIRIPRSHQFDHGSVMVIAWDTLIAHYNHAIVRTRAAADHLQAVRTAIDNADAAIAKQQETWAVLTFEVLTVLGIVGPEGVAEHFTAIVRNAMRSMKAMDPAEFENDEDHLMRTAAMLAILGTADDRAKIGIPGPLLHELTVAVMAIFTKDGSLAFE